MPRARVPHASFIASAESPLLPFLAPRVFAESPVWVRSGRCDRKSHGAQETVGKGTCGLRGEHTLSFPIQRSSQCTSRYASGGPASALLHTSSANLGRCYSDIFSLTRQHMRSYRTFTLTRQHMRSYRTIGTAGARKTQSPRSKAVAADNTLHDLSRSSQIIAARRQAAMAVERDRLANHLRYEPGSSAKDLLKQGKYRSLRRRISNLHRWNETVLDLSIKSGGSTKPLNLIRAFAALDRPLYTTVGPYTRKIVILHDPRCRRWSARLFQGLGNHEGVEAWRKWMEFDVPTRKRSYQRLLVYLLDRKPGRAVQFLYILAYDPLFRGRKTQFIADALGHLSKIHCNGRYDARQGWSQSRDYAAVRRSFVPAFVHIFRKALSGLPKVCSQDLLYNLAELADTEDLKKVFDCLIEHRAYLGFATVLHYADAFGRVGEFTYALKCLQELKQMQTSAWDKVSDRQRLRWTCALILRKSVANGQDYHHTPDIVAAIVGLGIKMDISLYNVVMHNAMDAGDYSTAFKVYNTLDSSGLKADKFTYSILLHGCASQTEPAMFSDFARHCARVARDTADPWLATDYLHYLYVRHHNDSDKEQTLHLLQQQYLRFFSGKPLEFVSIRFKRMASWLARPPDEASSQSATEQYSLGLTPPPVALYLLLQAHIQSAQAASTQQVLSLYQRFKQHVYQDSDAALTKLASAPIIWNAFLLSFCTKQQFASASQLLKDMTESAPQPNIYSWNIFMQAFFKTRQVQAAERVFEILRSRGVEPDGFTYGVLLRGYAKAQLVERIGETMRHVDSAAETDPDLLRALAKVLNRNKLMFTLDKVRLFKDARAQEKARAEAKEQTERWSEPRLSVEEMQLAMPGLDAETDDTSGAVGGHQSAQNSTPDFPQPASREKDTNPHHPAPSNPTDPEYQYRLLKQHFATPPTSAPSPTFKSFLPDPSNANADFIAAEAKRAQGNKKAAKDRKEQRRRAMYAKELRRRVARRGGYLREQRRRGAGWM